ncbi:hypothetical protein RRG08_062320 [Elysia crispata]|uniref:Uncharacterized protein n=1 Tax=Elysia crispata TaxID=231223 RepID=A0AAE0YG55_9GAST|nr:hypothetical protein RRG08_062320 [Elysia crispata]
MLCISHAAISSPQHSYNLFCVALFSAPLVNLRTTYRETDLPLLDLDPAVVGLEKVTVYYGVKPTRVTSWSDHLHLPKPLRRSCFNESFKLYLSLSSPFLYRLNLPVTTVLRRRRAPLPTGNGLPVALMMSRYAHWSKLHDFTHPKTVIFASKRTTHDYILSGCIRERFSAMIDSVTSYPALQTDPTRMVRLKGETPHPAQSEERLDQSSSQTS